jgi:hypothetical protein
VDGKVAVKGELTFAIVWEQKERKVPKVPL